MKLQNQVQNLTVKITIFLAVLLMSDTSYSMSFFSNKNSSQKITQQKPLTPPVSIPIDLTKKGNKLEAIIEIKERYGYAFELEFRYDDRGNDYLLDILNAQNNKELIAFVSL